VAERSHMYVHTYIALGIGINLPEFCDGILSELIELDFLREDVQGNIDRPSQPTAALVVVDDGLEAVPMAVKVVLVADGVEVSDTSGRIAQQRIRKLIKGTYLGLISQTTDLERKKKADAWLSMIV
jgi:hypothetical protein